jgi:hypothetical protein
MTDLDTVQATHFPKQRVAVLALNTHFRLMALGFHDGTIAVGSTFVSDTTQDQSISPETNFRVIARLPQVPSSLTWGHWKMGILLACVLPDSPVLLLRPVNSSLYLNTTAARDSSPAGPRHDGAETVEELLKYRSAQISQTAEGFWLEEVVSDASNCLDVSFSDQGLMASANTGNIFPVSIFHQQRVEGIWHLSLSIPVPEVINLPQRTSGIPDRRPAMSCSCVTFGEGGLLAFCLESGWIAIVSISGGGVGRLTHSMLLVEDGLTKMPRPLAWAPTMAKTHRFLAVGLGDNALIYAIRAVTSVQKGKEGKTISTTKAPLFVDRGGVGGVKDTQRGIITSLQWNALGTGLISTHDDGKVIVSSVRIMRKLPRGEDLLKSIFEESVGLSSNLFAASEPTLEVTQEEVFPTLLYAEKVDRRRADDGTA